MNEEVKHTPGPWIVERLKNGNVIVLAQSDELGSKGICHLMFTNEQPNANARLISAAPDMLAALKIARQCVVESFEHVKSTDDQYLADARLLDIDRAIAKAEGR